MYEKEHKLITQLLRDNVVFVSSDDSYKNKQKVFGVADRIMKRYVYNYYKTNWGGLLKQSILCSITTVLYVPYTWSAGVSRLSGVHRLNKGLTYYVYLMIYRS